MVSTHNAAAGSRVALAATDTVIAAFGKIGKWLADLAAVALSGSASDLTTGTLPAARIGDGSLGLAKLASIATARLLGRTTAGSGVAEALTGTQATALLDTFTSGAKGLVPASGGGTTTFLRADGTFAAPGGGSPGGSTGKVQFNNAGAFAGAADVEVEAGQLRLPAIATPTAPAAGGVKLYGVTDQGKTLPAYLGPDGVQNLLRVEPNPTRFYAYDDLIGVRTQGDFASVVSGTGATNVVATIQGDTGLGWMLTSLGSVATGRAYYGSVSGTVLRFGLGAARFRALLRPLLLSDATNTYTYRAGFIDSVSAESADGAFFRYTHSVNGGRFQAVTRANNVETSADTGIAYAVNTTYILEVRVNAAGSSAEFSINGALVATITTNIPTAPGQETGYGVYGQKSAGTVTLNVFYHDYILVEQYLGGR